MHVRIELFGGPEDGREITLPIGREGDPMTPLPLPSSPVNGEDSSDAMIWYEKDHRRHGVWIYKYKTPQSIQHGETL